MAALVDAAATGNRIQSADTIEAAIHFGKAIKGVEGLAIMAGSRIGAWRDLDLVRL